MRRYHKVPVIKYEELVQLLLASDQYLSNTDQIR